MQAIVMACAYMTPLTPQSCEAGISEVAESRVCGAGIKGDYKSVH